MENRPISKINLADKFSRIPEPWKPHIVAEVNDCYVKLGKFKDEFVWHHHENEDELFLVVKGCFTMKLKSGDLHIKEGEMVVIPRGVEHMPVADHGEAHVMLIEPKTTLNTGNVKNERTLERLERI